MPQVLVQFSQAYRFVNNIKIKAKGIKKNHRLLSEKMTMMNMTRMRNSTYSYKSYNISNLNMPLRLHPRVLVTTHRFNSDHLYQSLTKTFQSKIEVREKLPQL